MHYGFKKKFGSALFENSFEFFIKIQFNTIILRVFKTEYNIIFFYGILVSEKEVLSIIRKLAKLTIGNNSKQTQVY